MRAAYVFTDLPDQAGTFPVAELEAMADRGFEVELFCLRSRLADGVGARRFRIRFRVHRAGYLSPDVLAAATWELFTHPGVVLRTLARAVRDTGSSPRVLLKTLAIFPKCCLFAREVRRGRFDLLWAFWASLPGRAAWWISALTGIPYGNWAHAGNDIYNRAHQTEAALVTILGGARLVCTCNHANLEYFRTTLPGAVLQRIHYHPHGIDLSRFGSSIAHRNVDRHRALSAEPRVGEPRPAALLILSVGRLGEAKGFQYGVEALARLRQRGVAARYRIIGDGPMRAKLEARARDLGIADAIELPGAMEQERLPAEYRAADIFLMPSIVGKLGARDGLPNVLLEAMACGVPCIGSDAVGIPEAIEHGRTGLLAPPADPDGIAGALQEMAGDPSRAQRMAKAAQAMVLDQFGRDACMDRLAEIFRGVVGTKVEWGVRTMCILQLVPQSRVVGAESVGFTPPAEFARRGHETLLLSNRDKGPLLARERPPGLQAQALARTSRLGPRILSLLEAAVVWRDDHHPQDPAASAVLVLGSHGPPCQSGGSPMAAWSPSMARAGLWRSGVGPAGLRWPRRFAAGFPSVAPAAHQPDALIWRSPRLSDLRSTVPLRQQSLDATV